MTHESIKQDIMRELRSEPSLTGYDIEVDVSNNRIVLQGIVDTLHEKQLAYEIAQSISDLPVDSGVSISTDGTAIDKNIEFEVNEELNANPHVQLKDIGVDVKQGTARLVGKAQSVEEVNEAQEAASKARGVKRVLNQVKLTNGAGRIEPPHDAGEAKQRGLADRKQHD